MATSDGSDPMRSTSPPLSGMAQRSATMGTTTVVLEYPADDAGVDGIKLVHVERERGWRRTRVRRQAAVVAMAAIVDVRGHSHLGRGDVGGLRGGVRRHLLMRNTEIVEITVGEKQIIESLSGMMSP